MKRFNFFFISFDNKYIKKKGKLLKIRIAKGASIDCSAPFVFRFHRNEGNQESRIRVCFVGSVGRCRTTGSKLWRSMFFDVSLICCRSIYAGIPSKKYTGTLFTIYASFVNCEYRLFDKRFIDYRIDR